MPTRILVIVVCLGAATLGCRDSTAPHPPSTSVYLLDSLGGRPVPTIEFAGAGDTTIVLWGVLTLDGEGHAVTVQGQRHIYVAYTPEDQTFSATRSYRITNDSITVGFFGPCSGACEANEVGAVTPTSITLTADIGPRSAPVFHYRLIGTR